MNEANDKSKRSPSPKGFSRSWSSEGDIPADWVIDLDKLAEDGGTSSDLPLTDHSSVPTALPERSPVAKGFASSLSLVTVSAPGSALSPVASLRESERVDQEKRELQQQNEQLMDWIGELEESLNQCQAALQLRCQQSQELEALLLKTTVQAEECQGGGGREANLKRTLQETQQQMHKQQILVETLTLQLNNTKDRVAEVEREYTLTQKRFAEQTQRLVQSENECRSLKTRLSRQQRYTLQFKAALERCLEVSAPLPLEDPDAIEDKAIEVRNPTPALPEPVTFFPRSTPVQPWSSQALDDSAETDEPQWQKVAQWGDSPDLEAIDLDSPEVVSAFDTFDTTDDAVPTAVQMDSLEHSESLVKDYVTATIVPAEPEAIVSDSDYSESPIHEEIQALGDPSFSGELLPEDYAQVFGNSDTEDSTPFFSADLPQDRSEAIEDINDRLAQELQAVLTQSSLTQPSFTQPSLTQSSPIELPVNMPISIDQSSGQTEVAVAVPKPNPAAEPYHFWQSLAQTELFPQTADNSLPQTVNASPSSESVELAPATLLTLIPEMIQDTRFQDAHFQEKVQEKVTVQKPVPSLVLPGERERPVRENPLLSSPSLTLQASWPSPLVYPLRPHKKLSSLAAIDLPSFPKQ